MKDDEDEDEVMKRSDFISSCTLSGLTGAIFDDGPDPAHDGDDTNCLCDSCDPWVRPFDYRGSSAQPLDLTADAESEDGDDTHSHCLCDSCDPWMKRDPSLYLLISLVIPSLMATPNHLPSKRLGLLMMPGTKRKRMLMMPRTRATRQSRHPSHQAPLSMISLARTCSSPAGTMSAATNVTTEMSTSLS